MQHVPSGTTPARSRVARPFKRLLTVLGAAGILAGTTLALSSSPSSAYESAGGVGTGIWTAGAVTMPSGIVVSTITTGATSVNSAGTTQSLFTPTTSMFTPNIAVNTPAFRMSVGGVGCAVSAGSGTCTGRGNLTINFSQPVANPVLHLSGIGGSSTSAGNTSAIGADFTALTSTPAGATLGPVSGGKTNLQVVGGSELKLTTVNGIVNCDGSNGGAISAGCGSVPIVGTVTSITFAMSLNWATTVGNGDLATNTDDLAVSVTLAQDFSDAPSSYNGLQAPAHVIGDLHIGNAVDEDFSAQSNSQVSPFAATGIDVNGAGDNISGADEDAVNLPWPLLTTNMIGSTYTLTVPVVGASKPGEVCGYVDFDHAGNFNNAADRACTGFAVGASSNVVLTWTVPATMTAGPTYARLRAAYSTIPQQAEVPTGLASSGEVEDYEIVIMPTITVKKILPDNATGTFDINVNGLTLAIGIGNGYSTGPKTLGVTTATLTTPDIPGAIDAATAAIPLTVTETKTSGNTFAYTSAFACVDGGGNPLPGSTGTGTSITGISIPKSAAGNGLLQNITCTFTNNGVPTLALTKVANPTTITNFGQTVTYTFGVTNTGPITLSSLSIADTFTVGGTGAIGPITCGVYVLAPLASTTCTGTYVAAPADIDNGVIRNTAVATGYTPSNVPVLSNPASAVVTAVQTPSITILKTSDVPAVSNIGDPIKYSFLVTNTGNVTLTNVVVTDTFAAPAGPPLTITCPTTTLTAAGTGATSSMTCTATYISTAADFNNGLIRNTAIATGTPPTGPPVVSPPSTVTVITTPAPSIAIVKTADQSILTTVGQVVNYKFVVTNTGNVTLTNVTIGDTFTLPAGPALTILCPTTVLTAAGTGPTSSMTCGAAYTSTQADFDKGSITNAAIATGTPPSGPPVVSPPSTVTIITTLPPTELPPTGLSNLQNGVISGFATALFGIGLLLIARRRRLI